MGSDIRKSFCLPQMRVRKAGVVTRRRLLCMRAPAPRLKEYGLRPAVTYMTRRVLGEFRVASKEGGY